MDQTQEERDYAMIEKLSGSLFRADGDASKKKILRKQMKLFLKYKQYHGYVGAIRNFRKLEDGKVILTFYEDIGYVRSLLATDQFNAAFQHVRHLVNNNSEHLTVASSHLSYYNSMRECLKINPPSRNFASFCLFPWCDIPLDTQSPHEAALWLDDVPFFEFRNIYREYILAGASAHDERCLTQLIKLPITALSETLRSVCTILVDIKHDPMKSTSHLNNVAMFWPKFFRSTFNTQPNLTTQFDNVTPPPETLKAGSKEAGLKIDSQIKTRRQDILETAEWDSGFMFGGSEFLRDTSEMKRQKLDNVISLMFRDGFDPEYCPCCYCKLDVRKNKGNVCQSHIISNKYLEFMDIGLAVWQFPCNKGTKVITTTNGMKLRLQCQECDNGQNEWEKHVCNSNDAAQNLIPEFKSVLHFGHLINPLQLFLSLPASFRGFLLVNLFRMLVGSLFPDSPQLHFRAIDQMRTFQRLVLFNVLQNHTKLSRSDIITFHTYIIPLTINVTLYVADVWKRILEHNGNIYNGNFGVFDCKLDDTVLYIFFAPFCVVMSEKKIKHLSDFEMCFHDESTAAINIPMSINEDALKYVTYAYIAAAPSADAAQRDMLEGLTDKQLATATEKLKELQESNVATSEYNVRILNDIVTLYRFAAEDNPNVVPVDYSSYDVIDMSVDLRGRSTEIIDDSTRLSLLTQHCSEIDLYLANFKKICQKVREKLAGYKKA